MTFNTAAKDISINAKYGAIALTIGVVTSFFLALQEYSLSPLRLLVIGVIIFGVWAFCDEMGLHKPLVKVGFVSFIFAVFSKVVTILEPSLDSIGKYYLLYAFALLISIFIWSVAYLHRQRDLKVVGALGVFVSVVPVVVLIVGHVSLGVGTFFGVGSLLAAAEGAALNDFSAVNTIDFMFAVWSFITVWFLWRGHISSNA